MPRYLNPRQQTKSRAKNRQPNYHKSTSGEDYGIDWDALSLFIRKRDDWTCQAHKIGLPKCSNRFAPPLHHLLHAHHIIPLPRGLNHPKNLITLCVDCHSLEHGRRIGKPITEKQKRFGRKLR